ncbi:TPA: phage regulatory CII family protein [Escherichia albertii]|uniref:phage regulatory CII family protein n=1 Tax=Escherichia albertii TaxID=208962 RepID=UPI0029060B4B|nr:phage regulatory CII family protein [Escherichia albertii]
MFDFQISKHHHYDEACRAFAQRHNMAKLAERAGMNVQTLRNKLNPEQPHQLTPNELWLLTDLTEDSTLVDGFLAQIHCLPCVPVNELAQEKLQTYVMRAMNELGQLAGNAVSQERLTPSRKNSMIESVNSGIRMLSLTALALQARLQANPAMSSMVDAVNGLGASFGYM